MIVTCYGCHKTYDKKLSRIQRTEHNFCSRECFYTSKLPWKTWRSIGADVIEEPEEELFEPLISDGEIHLRLNA